MQTDTKGLCYLLNVYVLYSNKPSFKKKNLFLLLILSDFNADTEFYPTLHLVEENLGSPGTMATHLVLVLTMIYWTSQNIMFWI